MADSFGVDGDQLCQCFLPVGGDLAFDESSFGGAFGAASEAAFFGAVAGSFVFGVADREPEQLDDRGVVGRCPRFLMILRSW
jgi:hypothetical protein